MRLCLVLMTLLWCAGEALADPARDALSDLVKCGDIAGAVERLKCVDDAMPGARSVLSTPAPRAEAAPTQTESGGGVLSWFGLSRPATSEDFGKPPVPVASANEVTSINAKLTEFAKNAHGRGIFLLDNGQTWKQVEGDTTEMPDLETGKPLGVTIEVGLAGGYDLTVEGHTRMVKVRRLR